MAMKFSPVAVDQPIRGKAFVFGDNVPGDDGIVPFRVVSNIYETGSMDFGALAMTPIDPTFPQRFERGGILIAGANFPTGIAHEQAIWALMQVGVAAVVSETMSANFFQAATNDGLPAFSLPGISKLVREGDQLEVWLREGRVKNLTTGRELKGAEMPEHLARVLQAGGLRAFVAQQYRQRRQAAETR